MFPVPFLGPVQRPVSSGITIRITGTTPPNANIFNVNLQCGPSVNPRDDVAFHLSINFNSFTVVTNSILGNQWGPPEYGHGQFPFQRGQEFLIDLICEHSAFQVNVKGISTARFEHRVEPSRINHLAIDGDIILRNVEYLGGTSQGPIGFAVAPSLPVPGMPQMPGHPSAVGAVPPPYPSGLSPYPIQPDRRSPSPNHPHPTAAPYPQQTGPYPQQTGPYPQQPTPYPQQPGLYPRQPAPYPQQAGLYPQQAGAHAYPVSPSFQHKKKGLLDKVGLGSVGGVVGGAAAGVLGMKAAKKQSKLAQKARKKALKYGLPIAGVGLGAYALNKTFKHGHHGHHGHSSSSSSSSSSSDSD